MFFRTLWAVAVGGLLFFPVSGSRARIVPDVLAGHRPAFLQEHPTLAVLATFRGASAPSLPVERVEHIVFDELAAFYRENAYGRFRLTGEVRGWIELPFGQTCDTRLVRRAVIARLDPTIDFRDYDHVFVFAAYRDPSPWPGCGWDGLADQGPHLAATADGELRLGFAFIHTSSVNLTVVGHEFGHLVGLGHANLLDCGREALRLIGCRSREYSDYYSVMSRTTPARHLNAYHKDFLGFFTTGRQLVEVHASRRIVLTPIESDEPGVKAIKIPRGSHPPLYVEYRQPIGFDQGMDLRGYNDVFEGALLHTANERLVNSLLIDPTPPAVSYHSALKEGQAFTDPLTGSTVKVQASSPESLIIDVEFVRQASLEKS